MGDKIESILDGKMNVGVPAGYQVFEKKYPKSLKDSKDYEKYDWIGNFGFREKTSQKKVKGNMPKSYEIQVEDRANKDLVYWNGKKIKKFSGVVIKKLGKKKYRSVKLKMGDPPIGWVR